VRRPRQSADQPVSPAGGGPVAAVGDGPGTAPGGGPVAAAGDGPVTAAGNGPVVAAGGGAITGTGAGPVTTGRLRAVFLGPRGGGTLRRRASDAFRLGLAILVVAVSIPVMRANSAAELAIVHTLNPPPEGVRWLVTTMFWLGSVGVVAGLAVFALLVPRLAAVRRIVVAGLAAWAVCLLLGAALGPAAGRLFTAYLPPIWGWFTLAWMRRREYV